MRTFSGKVVRWRWLSPVLQQCRALWQCGGSRRRIHRRFNLNRRYILRQRERDRKDVTDGDKYKTNLLTPPGMPTSIFSLVMLLICSP